MTNTSKSQIDSASRSPVLDFTSSQLVEAAQAMRRRLGPLKEMYGLPQDATSDDLMVAFARGPQPPTASSKP